jgi:hypothetical protein
MTIVSLVERQPIESSCKEDIISHLEEALERARSGEMDALVLIERRTDGYWRWDRSVNVLTCDIVGRLEIVKAEIIAGYLQSVKQ